MKRRDARAEAFKLVFQLEYHDVDYVLKYYQEEGMLCDWDENCEMEDINDSNEQQQDRQQKDMQESPDNDQKEYIESVFRGVAQNKQQIDDIISKNAVNWEIDRISRVSLAILRVALYEMIYMDDIHAAVSINEAVELTKMFDVIEFYPRVNAILSGYLKTSKC